MASEWRMIANGYISKAIKDCIDEGVEDPKEMRKRISKAYPFGERKNHPYKIWLDEVKNEMKPFEGEADMPLFK